MKDEGWMDIFIFRFFHISTLYPVFCKREIQTIICISCYFKYNVKCKDEKKTEIFFSVLLIDRFINS